MTSTMWILALALLALILFPGLLETAGRRVPWPTINRTPRWLRLVLMALAIAAVYIWVTNLDAGAGVGDIQ
ncbi:MAG: hypothetical protein ACHQWU_03995 [Gemmatimonadales bacterium]|jgi:hypothetical protein